jgi:hypothetical protein
VPRAERRPAAELVGGPVAAAAAASLLRACFRICGSISRRRFSDVRKPVISSTASDPAAGGDAGGLAVAWL